MHGSSTSYGRTISLAFLSFSCTLSSYNDREELALPKLLRFTDRPIVHEFLADVVLPSSPLQQVPYCDCFQVTSDIYSIVSVCTDQTIEQMISCSVDTIL